MPFVPPLTTFRSPFPVFLFVSLSLFFFSIFPNKRWWTVRSGLISPVLLLIAPTGVFFFCLYVVFVVVVVVALFSP